MPGDAWFRQGGSWAGLQAEGVATLVNQVTKQVTGKRQVALAAA